MLQLDHVTRRFGDRTAVDNVSFEVPAGQIIGFVGANGAGKTTTMRMVMGVLAPSAGQVNWQGRPISDVDRRGFGYMPEERGLYPKQKVLDQLVFLGRLKGMGKEAARLAAMSYLERFGLAERAGDAVEKLSLGNQQRVQITAALMSDPACLILDEPFSGLDPVAIDSMAGVLAEHRARGVPILFSSHQLDLIDRLCDGLVILAGGRVVGAGTSHELRSGATRRHRLVLDGDAGWTRGVAGVQVVEVDGATAVLELAEESASRALLTEALSRGEVREFSPIVPTLSEIYREVTS